MNPGIRGTHSRDLARHPDALVASVCTYGLMPAELTMSVGPGVQRGIANR
jgi:hypothetical protein